MTERTKRNEVEAPDLYNSAEFLVFGAFREDEHDEGFTTTRWLPADALEDLEERSDRMDELAQLLSDTRMAVFDDDE